MESDRRGLAADAGRGRGLRPGHGGRGAGGERADHALRAAPCLDRHGAHYRKTSPPRPGNAQSPSGDRSLPRARPERRAGRNAGWPRGLLSAWIRGRLCLAPLARGSRRRACRARIGRGDWPARWGRHRRPRCQRIRRTTRHLAPLPTCQSAGSRLGRDQRRTPQGFHPRAIWAERPAFGATHRDEQCHRGRAAGARPGRRPWVGLYRRARSSDGDRPVARGSRVSARAALLPDGAGCQGRDRAIRRTPSRSRGRSSAEHRP